MQLAGVKPDEVTFVAILNVYNHTHSVALALNLFSTMEKKYGISPTIRHKAIIIDTLGRAGKLEQAEQFIYGLHETQVASTLTI
jgi:pentatricopeptide repeat protein